MSYTWAVNPITGDIFINKSGQIQAVYSAQEVKQRILIALQHIYGEYFLDVPAGIPWYPGTTATGQSYPGLLGSKNLILIESVIRMTILDVPNVISIASLSITYPIHAIRKATLNAQVEVYGINGPEIISIIDELLGEAV